MRTMSMTLALTVSLLISSLGFAEPLITMEAGVPKPGLVESWSGKGRKVELTLRDDADPKAVARAIQDGVERIRVKIRSGKLQVVGLKQAALLKALADIDLGDDDDADLDVLASAAAYTTDYDTGSSLRAKKTADLNRLLSDRKTTAMGRVKKVQYLTFPRTRVQVQVLRAPTGPLGKTVRKGRVISFIPVITPEGKANKGTPGRPDLGNDETIANMGAWYLKEGDRVQIKVGKPTPDGYQAIVITR